MSKDAASTENSPLILATALALEKVHGTQFAAIYLHDAGIAAEVLAELLYGLADKRTLECFGATGRRKQPEPSVD